VSLNTALQSGTNTGKKIRGILRISGLILAGAYVGLTLHRLPHYYDSYAARGLPAPYQGPKYYHWRNGVRVDAGRHRITLES
jgi:hypothetical protein